MSVNSVKVAKTLFSFFDDTDKPVKIAGGNPVVRHLSATDKIKFIGGKGKAFYRLADSPVANAIVASVAVPVTQKTVLALCLSPEGEYSRLLSSRMDAIFGVWALRQLGKFAWVRRHKGVYRLYVGGELLVSIAPSQKAVVWYEVDKYEEGVEVKVLGSHDYDHFMYA